MKTIDERDTAYFATFPEATAWGAPENTCS